MEATRSPFLCIIDYRIFFAVLALFTRGVELSTASNSPATSAAIPATQSGSTMEHDIAMSTSATAIVPVLGREPTTKLPLITPTSKQLLLPSKQPPVTEEATTHGKKTSALNVPTTTVSHLSKAPGLKVAASTSDLHPTAKQKTIDTQTGTAATSDESATTALSNATAVVQKDHSTSRPLTTSTEITSVPKISRPIPREHPGQSPGKGQAVTPWVGVPPDMTTAKTTAVSGTAASASPPNVPLIIAIILFLLLLLALLMACLYCRRRRRSGSTSFNAAGWAGQVALPDDTGLDKDAEQGPLAMGEGEGRRATLTTFFGKRQSRVASVAMEEIDGKEREQLIGENAGQDSSSQGPGEANGKIPEPTQTEIPPTRAE